MGYTKLKPGYEQQSAKSPGQRRKAHRDSQRTRACYDLPPDLCEAIAWAAVTEGVPASQLAAVLLMAGLRAYQIGKLELEKVPSRSPLNPWNLVLPDTPIVE